MDAATATAEFYQKLVPALNAGLKVSLLLIVPSAVLGFVFGVGLGSARVYAPQRARRIADGFVSVVRGVPLVIQLFFLYNVMPKLGMFLDSGAEFVTAYLPEPLQYSGEFFLEALRLDGFGTAVLGFVICSAAYQSEYIRGALISIRQGQIKAAQALGFSTPQMLLSVVIPQALRRALPGCGNEVIYLIKYSSLAHVVACLELTGQADILAGTYYRHVEAFLAAGAYYLAMTSVATFLLHWMERRYAIPGFQR
ncbi:MAG: Glutamine transport system permease protein GlnP [Desulfovibrio sp.]